MRRDNIRIKQLKDLWDKQYKELLERYKGRGKSTKSTLSKLMIMTEGKRDRIIKKHYYDYKRSYFNRIKKWVEYTKSPNKSPVNASKWVTNNTDFKAIKNSGVTKRLSSHRIPSFPEIKREVPKKPVFEYKLTNENMNQLILKSVETRSSF